MVCTFEFARYHYQDIILLVYTSPYYDAFLDTCYHQTLLTAGIHYTMRVVSAMTGP